MAVTALLLTACGSGEPVSVERAMAECRDRAIRATRPSAEITIGVGTSGHVASGLVIGVTDDFLVGRDPETVYRDCVVARSGEEPTEPYGA